MNIILEQELAYFDKMRRAWIDGGHSNEYVVVSGEDVLGFFGSETDAIRAGHTKFGSQTPFLVKRVVPIDVPVHFVSYELAPVQND